MIRGNFINIHRGEFHYYKIGDEGPQIHFCHGNSLSAGTYLPFLNGLADKGFQVFASDLRGHGFSTKERTAKVASWQIFIKDVAALVKAIAKPPVIGVGHSIGGYFTYAAAALYPHLFSKLVLLDPIIFPPMIVWAAALARKLGLSRNIRLSKMARNKKAGFGSIKEALDHYKGKGMFASWQDDFVNGFVETAIEPDAAGAGRLCCRPRFESQIYEHVPFNTWAHADRIAVPVLAVRGETSDLFLNSAGRRLEKKVRNCRFTELGGMGHFIPMEDPERVIDTILPFMTTV
jgi:pimeloyl-ACP methyl ester carboxylesterase